MKLQFLTKKEMSLAVSLNNNISLDFIDKIITVKTPRDSTETANNAQILISLSPEMLLDSDTNQTPNNNQTS